MSFLFQTELNWSSIQSHSFSSSDIIIIKYSILFDFLIHSNHLQTNNELSNHHYVFYLISLIQNLSISNSIYFLQFQISIITFLHVSWNTIQSNQIHFHYHLLRILLTTHDQRIYFLIDPWSEHPCI